MKSILHLNLHREFFAAIAARTKRIEYRAQTPFWRKRLEGRHYDVIQFRNGYATNAPEMRVEFRGLRRYAKVEAPTTPSASDASSKSNAGNSRRNEPAQSSSERNDPSP